MLQKKKQKILKPQPRILLMLGKGHRYCYCLQMMSYWSTSRLRQLGQSDQWWWSELITGRGLSWRQVGDKSLLVPQLKTGKKRLRCERYGRNFLKLDKGKHVFVLKHTWREHQRRARVWRRSFPPLRLPPVIRQLGASAPSVCWGRDNEAIHSHYSTITLGVWGPPWNTLLEVCWRVCAYVHRKEHGQKRH